MKYKLLRFSLLSIFAMLCGTVFADQVTMKYSGGTTTNMTGGNEAALFGLDANAWSVVGDAGANPNMPGLNKAGDFRLYWAADGGNTITVESLTGATINSISITFTGDTYSNVSVTVDGEAVTGTDGTWPINSTSFILGNANTSNAQVRISELVIDYSAGTTDNRAEAIVRIGEHAEEGLVGETQNLPNVTVAETTGNPIHNAEVTWSSSSQNVATISDGTISLVGVGTTTIKAAFAGNDDYKPANASYTLTVTATVQDGIFNFSYGLDYGSGLEQSSVQVQTSTWTAGNVSMVVSGRNCWFTDNKTLRIYKNNAGEGEENNAGTLKFSVPEGKQMTKIVFTGNAALADISSDVEAYDTEAFTWEGSANTVTFTVNDGASTVQIYTITVTYEDVAAIEPAEFQDFAVIVNNQEGTLLTADEQVQGTAVSFGVAVEDGQTIRVAADAASSIATVSGTFHSEHGMTGLKVVTAVPGAVKILVGQCTYSSKDIVVTNSEGAVVATATPATACWKNDRSNVTELIYNGEATTLTITGPDYCPFVAVEKTEVAPVPQDVTGTWTYADAGVMEATMAFSGSNEAGQVEAAEKNGLMMTVEANGATFRNNGDNIQVRTGAVFKIPVKNAGDLITVKGYPGYSYYTIGNSTEVLNDDNTYKAKLSDAEAGYVAVTSANDNNYYKSISVVQYAPKEKITLDNEAVTVAFPFNEGTEGQTATFTNADWFLNSKVTYGSNLTLKDKSTLTDAETQQQVAQTRFEPATKLNTADEQSAVRFMFTPKPGFTFQPTKVALNVTRYGTDNGLFDVTWEVADGNNIVLATEVKPARNNQSPNITKVSYDIEDAPAIEGTQSLLVHLYSLQENKQFGMNDIVIEGILNGTEKDVPILASFKVNGNEYTVEDVFGEAYEATLELPKAEEMVSANNPLTDVTAASGEVGTITYEEKEKACTVTIPMTAGETLMNYVLNVVFKPDFKLEYIGVDGSVLATQIVEKDDTIRQFAYDINEAPATKEGYKARGWFKTAVLGEKFTVADVVTADTKLYAIQTEIEEASTHKKYFFDLADKYFYPEDHEAFNPTGQYYWHDGQHGYAFKNGDIVDLLVGPKATITVTLCQYGSGTGIVVKKGEETLETLAGIADGDGGTTVYNYEGEAGTLTLEMQCGGEMYIHAMKIVNTAEVNFESQGNWYFVKAGDAGSLIDVLDVVNGVNASRDAERSFIFLPDGTYDLDATVKTAITGHNISLIGQSMDNTIIVTKPDISVEGLGKADLFDVSGTNLYMQDLTLQNALDYYNAGSAGRAAVLQDAGTRTIGKNVRMLSYQDTYYSSNSSQQAYWETCDIHGTVDFICGGGDIRFQNTTISLEPRQTSGKGGRTIVAPTTNTQFGYVFDGCTVVDLAKGQGDWNFGRTWQNEPICVYLNTTLDDNAKNTLVASRWTQKGMNNKDPKLFGEYGTKDENGNDITPASNQITSFGGTFETILNADQAAGFAYDKMFTDWDPATLAKQLDAPAAKYENGSVTWTPANDGAIAYALFKNGQFVALTEGTSFDNVQIADGDELTIRSANTCGGFGAPAEVTSVATSISELANGEQAMPETIYNLNGLRVQKAQKGLYIINGKKVVVK